MSVGPAPFYMLYEQILLKESPDLIDKRNNESDNNIQQSISALLIPVHI